MNKARQIDMAYDGLMGFPISNMYTVQTDACRQFVDVSHFKQRKKKKRERETKWNNNR